MSRKLQVHLDWPGLLTTGEQMANTNDLRYVRTENAIRSAFMELVRDKPIGAITASAICRQAGISRNAFYLHHASVSALHAALVGELVEDVRRECANYGKKLAATGVHDNAIGTAIVKTLAKHEHLLRALRFSDDGALAEHLAKALESVYVETARFVRSGDDDFEYRLTCAFAAWAHVGIVMRWIPETDRPLLELLPHFERLQDGVIAVSSQYLTQLLNT